MTSILPVPELSIFFPCHEERENVERMVRDSVRVGERAARRLEVIVVDDGSTDGTGEIAERLAGEDSRIRVLRHPSCRGYGAALRSGFDATRLDLVFYTDGDCQFEMEDLPGILPAIEGADVVSCYRAKRGDPFGRKLNSDLYGLVLRNCLGLRVRDVNCAFKVSRRRVLEPMTLTADGALIDAEMLLKAQRRGFRIRQLPVRHYPRERGIQSGAEPGVILRAGRELLAFWWAMRRVGCG